MKREIGMRNGTLFRASASLAALAFSCSAAVAQDGTEPVAGGETSAEEDAIVVTGFRESLESTRNIKRNSEQIVDSVVAEDIGKLPDLSVAETSARIPGVQVIRVGGEASRVLVRGLPDFATTYNGREIFTAETRVVALQDFPSSNISALEVFKTSTANLVEPGLAGLVNVRSRRPFDFDDFQFSGSVWGLYTKQGAKLTPNANLLVTDRWDTGIGEMGLLINASITEMQYLDSEPSNTDFIADPVINGQVTRFPDIQRLFYRSGNRVRPSANVAFQWQASPELEIYLEGLYQGFRNKIDDRLLEMPLYGGVYSNLVYRDGSNLLRSGTVTNPGGNIFTFQGGTYNKTDTYQYAGGARYENGPLKVSLDIARTDTTFRGSTESVDRFIPGPRTVNFNLDRPSFTVSGVDLYDPATYRFGGLYEENQRAVGKDWQARLDATYTFSDVDFLRSFSAGIRYVDRVAFREFANRFGGVDTPVTALPLEFRATNPGFRGANIDQTRGFVAPTYRSIRDNVEQLRQFVIAQNPGCCFGLPYTTTPITPNRLFDADEKSIAGYAQLNVGIGDTLDATVGIRGVQTETQVVGGVPTNIPGFGEPNKYTDWLPNASLRFRITPELQLRLSFAQTRTRPNFADLAPGTIGAPQPDGAGGTFRSGFSGNPFLQPFTSDNYDASLEYYFSRTGFASIAAFRRDLQGFIQTRENRFTDPTLGALRITQPFNTGAGRIDGLELQAQTFFDFLPSPLDGFGIQANYTRLDAKTDFFDSGPNPVRDRILGVSRWSYLLTGLFEKGPLSARMSYFKRGDSPETRQNRGNDFYTEYATYPGRLDFSLNVNFHPRVTLFADWTNILGKPFEQYLSSARNGAPRAEFIRFQRYEETTYSVGLRFRFGGE
jgi:iron complex outermembrane recepter protein